MLAQPTPRLLGVLACSALLAAGCGGSSGGGDATGNLTLGLTDGPVESADAVVVQFTGIVVKPKDGPALDPFVLDENSCDTWDAATETCSIDLLDLVGTNRRVVFSEELPAGEYAWVRLLVNAERNVMDSYLTTTDGMDCPLYIPSGSERGLQIVSGITVTANGVSDYTLDFDVRKSITNPPGLAGSAMDMCNENYVLKPAIRIVDTTEVGAIAGTVDDGAESPLAQNCTADEATGLYENVAVYVFEDPNEDVVPDDIDTSVDPEVGPVTTATVAWNDVDEIYEYEAGFLLAGTYRVALTCSADADLPDSDEYDPASEDPQEFGFIAEQLVEVQVDQTADGSF